MNKKDRAARRIKFDKKKKQKKMEEEFNEKYYYNHIFTYKNLLKSYTKCLKGVSWKGSVQQFMLNPITRAWKIYGQVSGRKLPNLKYWQDIIIRERGKERKITPIHIDDRIIQKTICDNLLSPLFAPRLIYDNGASLPRKGTEFTRKRLDKFLKEAIGEYGSDFYILRFDFADYFNSVSHKAIHEILDRYILDPELVDMVMNIVKLPYRSTLKKTYKDKEEYAQKLKELEEDRYHGMCLGSQVSQLLALIIPNSLDHYIKDVKGYKFYCRYMDDGIILARTKEELKELLDGLKIKCEEVGLKFSEKKTYIVKSSHGFTYLQRKYTIKDGTVTKRLCHKSIVRMRRKIKKYHRMYLDGKISLDDVYNSVQAWVSCAKDVSAYTTLNNMLELVGNLFGEELLRKLKGGVSDEVLQTSQ